MLTAPANYTIIGIPKGRLFNQIIKQAQDLGYDFVANNKRSLMFISNQLKAALIPLKSEDILTMVDQGLCDLGILGLDIIKDHYKEDLIQAPLKLGRCRMSIAGLPEVKQSEMRYIRLATKYPRLGEDFLKSFGVAGEVLPMKSSVEVAPFLGLADCILDIIETGTTLKANGLEEWFTLFPVSCQLIAKNQQVLKSAFIERMLYV